VAENALKEKKIKELEKQIIKKQKKSKQLSQKHG